MLMEDVLKRDPKILTKAQREQFFEEGCAVVEGVVDDHWLRRIRAAMDEMVDLSRTIAEDDGRFILEEGHSPEDPRLRRLVLGPARHLHTLPVRQLARQPDM